MTKRYTSTDESVVLGLAFEPVDGPGGAGSVTVPTASGWATIDGTDYTGISGSCTFEIMPNADPGDTSVVHTGTFVLTVGGNTAPALSGTVTGSFDSDRIFCPHSFTEVILAASLGVSDSSLTLLPPPDEDDVAMGTASVIIKPT